MNKKYFRISPWYFYSLSLIIIYSLFQILRWKVSPQFIDIYYHLLTAWGFIKAGGYSGWDFWQYAPVGRIHIYPPFFHIILAFFIKLGIGKIVLVKFFETVIPITFLVVFWDFIRRNYSERLGLFVLIALGSSFSFYLSLTNYLTATLAMIFGFLFLNQLLQNKFLRASLLLTLCFYTHIGMSWFFALAAILYSLFKTSYLKSTILIFLLSILLSLPILWRQVSALKFISISNISNENYFCEFKFIDYLLALSGIIFILKSERKNWLFLGFFLSGFIFIIYPYRFFSAQGYLPIVILSAFALNEIWGKLQNKRANLKYFSFLLVIYYLFMSPTILMNKVFEEDKVTLRANFADTALMNLIFPDFNKHTASTYLWFPSEYLPLAELIKRNSEEDDIVYSDLYNIGTCLASISGRATANRLFPEIKATKRFNPYLTSKMIVSSKKDDSEFDTQLVKKYQLVKMGETKVFILYDNPAHYQKVKIEKASVPFWVISFFGLAYVLLFILVKN